MGRKREYDPAEFIRTTFPGVVDAGSRRDPRPVLGIDEGLNNEMHIGELGRRLLGLDIIGSVVPLWYQQRVDKKVNGF